jgi:hypothetical protein
MMWPKRATDCLEKEGKSLVACEGKQREREREIEVCGQKKKLKGQLTHFTANERGNPSQSLLPLRHTDTLFLLSFSPTFLNGISRAVRAVESHPNGKVESSIEGGK